MKRKKQISVGIALFALLVVSLSSWFLVKHEELKATQSPETLDRTVYNIPEPAKINTLKLDGNSTTTPDEGDGGFGTVYNRAVQWLPEYHPHPIPGCEINDGGWLNAATSYIPKVNAVGFKYYSGKNNAMKTEIIGWSSGIGIHKQTDGSLTYDYGFGLEINGSETLPYNNYVQMNLNSTVANPTGQQWIAFTNIGFYNGQPIGGLMKITPKDGLNLQQKSSVGIGLADPVSGTYTAKVDSLFSVIMAPRVPYVDVAYEFFYAKDLTELIADDGKFPEIPEANKLELAPYLCFDRLKVYKTLTFNTEIIKNVYSVPRDYKPSSEQTTLTYIETAGQLKVTNNVPLNSTAPLSHLFSLTPKDNQEMQYRVSVQEGTGPFTSHNGAYYSVETPVKVEFPDPQPTTTTYEEIIENGKGIIDSASQQKIDDFSYQFVQSIPWETGEGFYAKEVPINNRTQFPTWQLKTNDVENAPIGGSGVWQVQSLDNPALPTAKWFTVSEDNKQITPKDTVVTAGDSDFYNHLYSFEKNVQIDYDHKVTKKDLALTTVGDQQYYYYSVKGNVTLKVTDSDVRPGQDGMNLDRPEDIEYESKINFYAPIKYRYVYKDAAGNLQEISGLDATSYPTQGDGIVTWDAPLTPMTYGDYRDNGEIPPEKTQAPAIAGYTFKSAAFNDRSVSSGNLAQVEVTKLLKENGDENEATHYSENNVVTLEYQPPNYAVALEVTKPNGDTLVPDANTYFEVSSDNGTTWTPVSDTTFAAGSTYQIRQKDAIQYYTPAGQSPNFTVQVNVKEDGSLALVAIDDDDDYRFIQTELASDKKLIIKVVNRPSGGIVLSQVEELDYGTVQMPRKDRTIKRVNPDWKINYEDNRPPEIGNKLYFYVTLTQEFTEQEVIGTKILPGILAFINEPGEITEADILAVDTPVLIKTKENLQYGKDSLQWSADAGFLLQIDKKTEAKLNVGQGQKYQAELTFTLAEDPL